MTTAMTTTIPTPTRRILFVDDDPQLLSGLGKALRKHRHRWTMVFADSGDAALAEVHREPFDVVVSDMRMPEIDGATLLHAVKDESPTTILILLTGYADDDMLARVRPVLHQLLHKPCSAATLRDAIECTADNAHGANDDST
jgi:DNA-binding NtrC family response regulator